MKKRLSFKQSMFLLPLLLLISVFALYPIASSIVYSLFDYRTNNQEYAGLYVEQQFNASLFSEDLIYVPIYLEEKNEVYSESDSIKIEAILEKTKELEEKYKDYSEVITINKTEAEEINVYLQELQDIEENIYQKIPLNEENQENFSLIIKELGTCTIESNFVGLKNYEMLAQDKRFGESIWHTLFFTIVSVACELVLGMLLAIIMNKAIKGIGIVRTTSLIPWAIPTAVSALIWSYMYDGGSGVIAHIFTKIGLVSSPEVLLLSSGGAMFCTILADVWKTTPYMALLLLSGLQIIDQGLYESARIDGAKKVQIFRKITLPLLKSSILIALLFRTLDAFRVYDLIALLTGGGPGGATESLSIYAYKVMISQSNYGYGSAIVIAMVLCVAVIAFIYIKGLGAEIMDEE